MAESLSSGCRVTLGSQNACACSLCSLCSRSRSQQDVLSDQSSRGAGTPGQGMCSRCSSRSGHRAQAAQPLDRRAQACRRLDLLTSRQLIIGIV